MKDTSRLKLFKDALKDNGKLKIFLFILGFVIIAFVFCLVAYTSFTTIGEETLGILAAPSQLTPIINSSYGTNLTSENITVYNQSTGDVDADPIKNIYSWDKNNNPFDVLNLPFEGPSNSSITYEYSSADYSISFHPTVRPSWNAAGGWDGFGCYDFNTSSYFNISDSNNIDFTINSTFVFWIKAQNNTGVSGIFAKGAPGAGNNHNYLFGVNFTSPVNYGVSSTIYSELQEFSNAQVLLNTWQHMAIRFNGSKAYIFQNGSFVDSIDFNLAGKNDLPLIIGGGLAGAYFNGSLDDFKIYRQVLSDEQISSFYNYGDNRIHSTSTELSDTFRGHVIPNAGDEDGNNLSSVLTVKAPNSAPSIVSAHVNSSVGLNKTGEAVKCYVNITDANVGDSFTVNYTWYKNGVENLSGEKGLVLGVEARVYRLGAGATSKGDDWNCSIVAYDGTNYSTARSMNITILNTAPTISSVVLNSSSGTNLSSEELRCYVSVADDDFGETFYANYSWYKNGVESLTGQTLIGTSSDEYLIANLSSGNTTAGDAWICSVNSYDGTDYSASSSNATITILAESTSTSVSSSSSSGGSSGGLVDDVEVNESLETEEVSEASETEESVVAEVTKVVKETAEDIKEEFEKLTAAADVSMIIIIVLLCGLMGGFYFLKHPRFRGYMVQTPKVANGLSAKDKVKKKIEDVEKLVSEGDYEQAKKGYSEIKSPYSKLDVGVKKKFSKQLEKLANSLSKV